VHLDALVRAIKKQARAPISVSCQPLKKENILLLKQAGVDRIGIALDAATSALFEKVKGEGAGCSYSWENQFCMMNEASAIFGKGNVSTHIIVGLGETEKEATQVIQKCVDMAVLPALFAFTPVRGTALEHNSAPSFESYRRLQLARYLIVEGSTRLEKMSFDDRDKIISFGIANQALRPLVEKGTPFLTSGCQNCNRPFYNEKPSGPLYNYPRKPSLKEIEEIKKQLGTQLC
jgi:biotin synthase